MQKHFVSANAVIIVYIINYKHNSSQVLANKGEIKHNGNIRF